ncbi:MAG: SapC family protein [Magnetococcus sp. DMHC-6]
MSQLTIYQNPVPLNKETHKNFKISPSQTPFSFAAQTNSVVLAGIEFVHAAKEYGIIFSRVGGGEVIVPVALLGMRNEENLFVDEKGQWAARYIPAFVRRYPFVLAQQGEGSPQMMVCVDDTYPGFNQQNGESLFTEAGEATPLLDKAISFLKEYQSHYQRTEIFVNHLKELDLFVELTARADLVDGKQYAMGGLLAVDEKKLLNLPENKVVELFRSGELGWIYSHLSSLSNIRQLADKLSKKS